MRHRILRVAGTLVMANFLVLHGAAQQPAGVAAEQPSKAGAPETVAPELPPGYVIGQDDVLTITFWREKDMSAEVMVRPDGHISLPLLNDVPAAGYTPEQLRSRLMLAASKFMEEPNATVVVKEIRSRKVFITGNVGKPGTYPLVNDMNVLQFIALAGGLQEYADVKNIVIVRREGAEQRYYRFNYRDVVRQKNVEQNITLKPGDTVIIP